MRELLEIIAVVKGDVQAVGFRARAKRIADGLELKGYARNLTDGSVELCAQGKMADLEKLLTELEKTFSSRQMEISSKIIRPAVNPYSDFSIL
jgi:acylphosphatase